MHASAFASSPPKTPDPVVGPRLRLLLYVILGFAAALAVNSAYLSGVMYYEHVRGLPTDEGSFRAYMVTAHLALGLLLVVPVLLFGFVHLSHAHNQPNRRAVGTGYILFGTAAVLLFSGIGLMWSAGFDLNDPPVRTPIYWAHVITPLLAAGFYFFHRFARSRNPRPDGVPTEIKDPAIARRMNVAEP